MWNLSRWGTWQIAACAGLTALAACGASSDCAEPQQVVAPSSGSAPGTLQSGALLSPDAGQFVAFPGGAMCWTCNRLVTLDGQLHEVGHSALGEPDRIAAASDGSIYVVNHDATLGAHQIVALSPTGQVRWTYSLRSPISAITLVAGPEGPYVGGVFEADDGARVPTIRRFDAASGVVYQLPIAQEILGAAHYGVFTVEGQGEPAATLRQLDRGGNVVWSHALTSTKAGVQLGGAEVAPDGGAIVFGFTPGALDLGDRKLDTPSGSFIARFDAAGATRWVQSYPGDLRHVAVNAQGEILLASQATGGFASLSGLRSHLAVMTPDGAVARTLSVGGAVGDQTIEWLATTSDGAVWMAVSSTPDPDEHVHLFIGDQGDFAAPGTYLFKLVP
jgi:hypothetical protein